MNLLNLGTKLIIGGAVSSCAGTIVSTIARQQREPIIIQAEVQRIMAEQAANNVAAINAVK